MLNILYFIQASIFIYFSFLTGDLIFRLLKIKNWPKLTEFASKIMMGYGLIGLAGLIFGLLGIFKTTFFYLFFAVILFFAKNELQSHLVKIVSLVKQKNIYKIFKIYFQEYAILKIIILVWLFFYFFISFLPSALGNDGLAYHLPFSFDIIKNAKINFPFLNNDSYGHLPAFTEIFYAALILIFKNIIVFKIIQFATSFLLLLFLLDLADKYLKNKILKYLIIIGFLSILPFHVTALAGGLIDSFVFLYGLASFFILISTLLKPEKDKHDRGKFLISAVFFSLALSMKYTALFFAIINYSAIVIIFLTQKKSPLKHILNYTATVFFLSGFWYLKNLIYTGNPFYPISFLGHDSITNGMEEYLVINRNFFNFFLFPFVLLGKNTILKLPYAFYNAGYFAFMYLVGLWLILKKKTAIIEIALFGFVQFYLFLLFFWTHQIRFAVPALIIVLILDVFILDKLLSLPDDKLINSKKLLIVKWLLPIVAIILLGASFNAFKTEAICLASLKSANECLADSPAGSAIYVVDYANRHIQNSIILNYWNPFYEYFLSKNNKFADIVCENKTENADINNCLRAADIKYLMDDTSSRRSHEQNTDKRLAVTQYFINNSALLYEYYDAKRNSYHRLYELNK